MSEEQIQRVFSEFTQADESTTRRFGGTGLGLALSRKITTLLGGTLTVQSALGQGSLFTVGLPFHDAKVLTVLHSSHRAPMEPSGALSGEDLMKAVRSITQHRRRANS